MRSEPTSRIYEVVGVVGDVRMEGLGYAADAGMYLSYEQRPQRTMRLALRTAGNGTALAGPLRGIVREFDPNIPVTDIETMEAVIAGSEAVNRSRVTTGALAAFALVALLLAAVGLYGVLAHYVSQRRHEIGVRMALGAEATSVLRSILWRGLLLVGLGLIVGVAGALFATGLVEQHLYGVTPTDPTTYLATVAFFVVVATFSCLVPAWRAFACRPARRVARRVAARRMAARRAPASGTVQSSTGGTAQSPTGIPRRDKTFSSTIAHAADSGHTTS